jgi:cold shock CspA family protein
MSVNRLEGKIDWFDANKGFGIIKCEGDEVFIHHSGIQSNTDNYKVLYENEEVEFEISEDNTGRLCATKVTGSGGTKLQFENSTPSYKKQSKNKKKVRNTESFAPSHIPADLKVIVGNPSNETLDMKLDSRDFVLISSLFEDDETMYDTLLEEIQQSGIDEQELWKLWHGDSHLIADDHLEWKKSCPTFQKIIDRISKYFEMEPKSTRLNWYENSDQWKPYHHDAAAIKPHIAKNQNLTVGISFGATREIAFEHTETKAIVSFPLPNGTVYAFGNDVNSTWKHGIPQIPEENRNNDGRISIIVWGWSDEQ